MFWLWKNMCMHTAIQNIEITSHLYGLLFGCWNFLVDAPILAVSSLASLNLVIESPYNTYRNFSMIGNLAKKNTGDKSKSEIGIAWEKFESDNVFRNLGITKK